MKGMRFAVKVAAGDLARVAYTYKRRCGETPIYHRINNVVKALQEIARDMLMEEGE